MNRLTSIVARNEEGAIGARNSLPWRVKSDMQFFRRETLDKVVVLGRRTYESLGGCLPRRTNIVVTHGFSLFPESAACRSASGIDEALVLASLATRKRGEAYVIGGATMYNQFAPFVDRYLITVVNKRVRDADTFFNDAIMGDRASWSCNVIEEGRADGAGNEADYTIFEYIALDRVAVVRRREAAIERIRVRARKPYQTAEGDFVAQA